MMKFFNDSVNCVRFVAGASSSFSIAFIEASMGEAESSGNNFGDNFS